MWFPYLHMIFVCKVDALRERKSVVGVDVLYPKSLRMMLCIFLYLVRYDRKESRSFFFFSTQGAFHKIRIAPPWHDNRLEDLVRKEQCTSCRSSYYYNSRFSQLIMNEHYYTFWNAVPCGILMEKLLWNFIPA